jgi:signal transduction histidine kinase
MSTVLIVDDSQSARETLLAALDGQGYQLVTAQNGSEALQLASEVRPDVILLDVMMPGMDGFEVCRRIRATPELAEVPIALLTALDDHTSLLKGLEAGADDFFTKPIERKELLVRLRTITRLNRYRTLAEQREKLSEMAEHVVTAQEEERLRISRELHDDLGQALTTHLLAIRNLQSDLSIPVVRLFESLENLYQQSYEIFVKIRRLAHDLRPPVLDTLGLKLSLETYCHEFTNRTHLPITLEIDPVLPEFIDVYNVILYRVLQESLTNIAKHAQASRVWVELNIEDNTINLIVQDNGRGLPSVENKSNGIGITGMQERLSLVGGKFLLHSPSEGGTILSASLPMKTQTSTDKEDI